MQGKEKMKNKIFLFMLLGLFLISFCSASLGGYNPNECVNIKTILNTSAVTISSLNYPNSSTALGITKMEKNGLTFNYTFCDTSTQGTYNYDYNDTEGNVYVNDFIIGKVQTTAQGLGSTIFLILMVVLMVTFGLIGFKLFKTENFWVLGVFFVFLSFLLLIYNTWLGYEFHKTLTGLQDSSIPEIIFYIFLLILVLGLLVSITLLVLNWKKVFKYIKREIKRNDNKDDKDVEDWDFKEFDEK
jgi:succinate dehydrogenase/fumarate reductase cytochrome b subunit